MARGNVRIDIDIEGGPVARQFRQMGEDWPRHRAALEMAIGEDLVGRLKREVGVSTGRLRGTIRAIERLGGLGGVSVVAGGEAGVDYVLPYIEGREPGPPGSSDPAQNPGLARWAARNNYPGGFDAIYWSIARYGTEAHDFVSQPTRETESRAGTIASQVLRARGAFE